MALPTATFGAVEGSVSAVRCRVSDAAECSAVATVCAEAATTRVAAELGISLEGDLTDDLRAWPRLSQGAPVAVGDILFPRLDREAVLGAA